MFTGIIETTGVIKKIENKNGKVYFTVAVKNFLRDVKIGSSIACDGVCLTVIEKIMDCSAATQSPPEGDCGDFSPKAAVLCGETVAQPKDSFVVELMPETLKVTKFKQSKAGDLVNLEKSLKIGERLDGHFVMGHADGTGVVDKIVEDGEYREIIVKAPAKLMKYLVYKGSVAVNGVSLTISGIEKNKLRYSPSACGERDYGVAKFKVSLITHTLQLTNLSGLRVGSKVNLEIDMLARYLESIFRDKLGKKVTKIKF